MTPAKYNEKVTEHFLRPRNVGTISDADAVGTAIDQGQDRLLKLYLRLDQNKHITEAAFQSFGCPDAVASASALTELLPGKTVQEAAELDVTALREILGQVPEEEGNTTIKCLRALQDALANTRS